MQTQPRTSMILQALDDRQQRLPHYYYGVRQWPASRARAIGITSPVMQRIYGAEPSESLAANHKI